MRFFILLFVLWSSAAWSQFTWRSGDVILMSLNCYVCRIIENETQSSYSHAGMVWIDPQSKTPYVFESWNSVRKVTLNEFLSRRMKGRPAAVYRFKELHHLQQTSSSKFSEFEQEVGRRFHRDCEGLFYDRDFRWDNVDGRGLEKYYCTELVAKLINPFLKRPLLPTPMSFERNIGFWKDYFDGKIPHGEIGNSPGDFERSELLDRVMVIADGPLL